MAYESKEDPPSLTKGRGIPVGINKPIEVEILMKAWKQVIKARVKTVFFRKRLSKVLETLMAISKYKGYKKTIKIPNKIPTSSIITE